MSTVLELKHITKVFPGVKSLDDVSLSLEKGEVHALIGENGAGKSTLMKVMAGIYIPEEGEIIYKEKSTHWKNPLQARVNGISVIHQELKLAGNLSIAENIMMGQSLPKNKFGFVDWSQINKRAKELLIEIGSDMDPKTIVSTLSVAQQQIVEIARALSIQADVIIMDEPSATLTDKEIDKLFELIRMLKQQDVAIVYVSHRMVEIFTISDRCTILRDGKYIATKLTKDTNEDELVRLMVGRELSYDHLQKEPFVGTGSPLLEATNFSNGKTVLNAHVNVYPGEIVGIAGLVGAGRSEFLHLIFSSDKAVSGEIKLNGEVISPKNPRNAISKGIAFVPESRKDQALFLELGVGENISSLTLKDFASMGWIN
ncbi:MAG TPA: sugar ABC transporter ATP-binding protein, partial [Bacillales bacterium]|nr:sugar ABC transporter ATP-binding protein [Bacillales bacterium]